VYKRQAYTGIEALPYLERQRAHNIFAKPKIEEKDLYFADRKAIYCLDKHTGKLFWEKIVEEELGVSTIDLLTLDEILVLGKGYRYVNYSLDKDRKAVLLKMDKGNGRILKEYTFPKGEYIINLAINDAFIYVLTDEYVHQFDYNLTLLESFQIPSVYGSPMRVVTWSSSRYDDDLLTDIPDFPFVVRTEYGVLALHPVTLQEFWYQRLGALARNMPPVEFNADWQIPLLLQDHEQRRSWVDEATETFWFAKAGSIIGLDLINGGATVAQFELDSDDFWYVGNGELIQYGGNEVRLLQLRGE